MNEQFKIDVDTGLSSSPKSLSSKYFYDKKGDKLFQEIMAMPEYYLTRAEMEIFTTKSKEIVNSFEKQIDEPFELIE
ncbi:MAG: L-histidine N(alpha)-methyltransferase, partial [Winogradskyella sp.]